MSFLEAGRHSCRFDAKLMGVNEGQTSQGGRRAGCGRMEVAHMQIGYSFSLPGGGGLVLQRVRQRDANLGKTYL